MTLSRARPICRHKSLETKTYPRGHANLPTPDRSASESANGSERQERDFHERRVNDGDDPGRKRERTRVNKREIMTRPRPTFRTHTAARARARTCTFTCSRVYGRQSTPPRHAGSGGGATESEGATRDARRISEEAREARVRDGERERERENVDQRRGVLAWMTRHCRGARVPRNHTACTRVYTRTHAYAARAGTSEALSARYARVHWVTWKCVS